MRRTAPSAREAIAGGSGRRTDRPCAQGRRPVSLASVEPLAAPATACGTAAASTIAVSGLAQGGYVPFGDSVTYSKLPPAAVNRYGGGAAAAANGYKRLRHIGHTARPPGRWASTVPAAATCVNARTVWPTRCTARAAWVRGCDVAPRRRISCRRLAGRVGPCRLRPPCSLLATETLETEDVGVRSWPEQLWTVVRPFGRPSRGMLLRTVCFPAPRHIRAPAFALRSNRRREAMLGRLTAVRRATVHRQAGTARVTCRCARHSPAGSYQIGRVFLSR
jgi:hypothetical protein